MNYLAITEIIPAQLRCSQKVVAEKIAKAIHKGNIQINGSGIEFSFNNQTSMLPPEKAIRVLKTPFGFLATDGHHRIKASITMGASTVPTIVIGECGPFGSIESFWQWATVNNYAYPFLPGGEERVFPKSFNDLIDDPLRYFVAATAARYKNGQLKFPKLSRSPLWIKTEHSEAFIEFRLADILYQHGFHYPSGHTDPEKLVKQARHILRKVARTPSNGLAIAC